MDESIYNLIPIEKQKPIKHKMYRSQIPGNIAPTGSTFNNRTTVSPGVKINKFITIFPKVNNVIGDIARSIGPHSYKSEAAYYGKSMCTINQLIIKSQVSKNKSQQLEPLNYLKKSQGLMGVNSLLVWSKAGEQQRSLSPQNYKSGKVVLKPLVPKMSESILTKDKSKKNFIQANAIEAILTGSLHYSFIISLGPRTSSIERSSITQIDDWNRKKDFGKVPDYLIKRKQEMQQEYDLAQSIKFEEENQTEFQPLSQEEVDELKAGLTHKWNEINKKYQMMTHIQNIDTVGQRRRKLNQEKELDQIQNDLNMLKKSYVIVQANK